MNLKCLDTNAKNNNKIIIKKSPQCPGAAATAQGWGSRPCVGRRWRGGILLCRRWVSGEAQCGEVFAPALSSHGLMTLRYKRATWLVLELWSCCEGTWGSAWDGHCRGRDCGSAGLQESTLPLLFQIQKLSAFYNSKVILAPFQCFLATPSSGILLSWSVHEAHHLERGEYIGWQAATYQLGVELYN